MSAPESSRENRIQSGSRGHAVVTGCSSGIGAAIARRLLDEGWQVTGLSRTRPPLDA